MAYLVNLTARVERDLALLFNEIDAEHSDAALKWYRGPKEAILSLEEHPSRCPVCNLRNQPEKIGGMRSAGLCPGLWKPFGG